MRDTPTFASRDATSELQHLLTPYVPSDRAKCPTNRPDRFFGHWWPRATW